MGISAIYSVVNVQFVYLGGQYPFDALIIVWKNCIFLLTFTLREAL